MRIEDLRLFVDVARLGGFAPAARLRNADPSAISRSIATLEADLKVRLFQRTTRKVSLTQAGELFFGRVATLIEEFERTCDDARSLAGDPSGLLRATASNAFGPTCLAPVLAEFRRLYPRLSLELLLSDERLDLVAERIDLAVRLGAVPDKGLTGTKLFDTEYRVCVSPAYMSRAPLKQPSDLATHECLLFPFAEFRSRWTFRSPTGFTQDVPVKGSLITSSALTLKASAMAGMGPALLPHWLVDDEIRAGRLVDPFKDYRVSANRFDTAAWIVYPSRRQLPMKVKALSAFLLKQLQRYAPNAPRK